MEQARLVIITATSCVGCIFFKKNIRDELVDLVKLTKPTLTIVEAESKTTSHPTFPKHTIPKHIESIISFFPMIILVSSQDWNNGTFDQVKAYGTIKKGTITFESNNPSMKVDNIYRWIVDEIDSNEKLRKTYQTPIIKGPIPTTFSKKKYIGDNDSFWNPDMF